MKKLISICAWCHSVKTAKGWMSQKKALRVLQIRGKLAPTETTHGICPSCASKALGIDPQTFKNHCKVEARRVA